MKKCVILFIDDDGWMTHEIKNLEFEMDEQVLNVQEALIQTIGLETKVEAKLKFQVDGFRQQLTVRDSSIDPITGRVIYHETVEQYKDKAKKWFDNYFNELKEDL